MTEHNWVKFTYGHGETMCTHCHMTNREAAALGLLNECEHAPALEPLPTPAPDASDNEQVRALFRKEGTLTVAEIIQATAWPSRRAYNTIGALVRKGELKRVSRGEYAPADLKDERCPTCRRLRFAPAPEAREALEIAREALRRISDACPDTCDMTTAHGMAAVADEALARIGGGASVRRPLEEKD